jgi:molecular chaperone GrpE
MIPNENVPPAAATDAVLAEKATPPPEAATATSAEQQIQELKAQVEQAQDRALRAAAELENFRKRTQREMADERRYAIVPLVRDLLPVLDNLERAIAAAQTAEGGAALLEGVKLVVTQLEGVLQKYDCVRIATVGTPFDPHQHQAVGQEPSEQFPAGTVTRAVQAGYKLHDRVIRPAQVFVSTGPPAAAQPTAVTTGGGSSVPAGS